MSAKQKKRIPATWKVEKRREIANRLLSYYIADQSLNPRKLAELIGGVSGETIRRIIAGEGLPHWRLAGRIDAFLRSKASNAA